MAVSERNLKPLYRSRRQFEISLQVAVLLDETVPQHPDGRTRAVLRPHRMDMHHWNPSPGDLDRLAGLRDPPRHLGDASHGIVADPRRHATAPSSEPAGGRRPDKRTD